MTDDILGKPQRQKPGPKPRQRPAADMTERDMEQSGLSLDPREKSAHESDRPKRVLMHGAMKLSIPANLIKPDHTARWASGRDSRIQQMNGAYWEHIKDSDGNNMTRQSGPHLLYAMQLHNQYVEEDKALKRAKIAARINKEAAVGANEYTNHSGNSAISVESANPHAKS